MIDYAVREGVFRTPRGLPVRFRYREGTNDWNTLTACLNEDEYGLRDLPPLTGSAADLGGYLGAVGIALAADNPTLRVLIVEPVPDNVELTRWAVEANRLDARIVVEQGAIGDGSVVEVRYRYSGTETAVHHAFVGNSSLSYDHGGFLPHHVVSYPSLTPADIVERIGTPAFVKMDTEGAEWAFLAAGAALLPLVVGEWHPVRGYTRGDLLALLADTHEVTFTGPEAGPGGFRAVAR